LKRETTIISLLIILSGIFIPLPLYLLYVFFEKILSRPLFIRVPEILKMSVASVNLKSILGHVFKIFSIPLPLYLLNGFFKKSLLSVEIYRVYGIVKNTDASVTFPFHHIY